MEVQTRSDSHRGKHPGCNYFSSVKEAYEAWKTDKNIWKISFDDKEGEHRYRPKLRSSLFNLKSEERMCQLSQTYKNATPSALFWVDQLVMPVGEWDMRKVKTDPEYGNLYMAACIKNVLSDEEFKQKYDI